MDPVQEIKQLGEGLKRDFESFKEAHKAEIRELKEKGFAPADYKEKVDRVSEGMAKIEDKIEGIKTAMARAPQGDAEAEAKAENAKIVRMSSKAMQTFLRRGRVSAEDHAAYVKEMGSFLGPENSEFKSLSTQSDPDGGYFVRPMVSAEITKKVFESSPMRELADSITISTDTFEELYDYDEPDSGWVGEMATRSETDTNQMKKIMIAVHELHASPKASQKLLDDSMLDVESWHAGKVAEKFARDEATAFIGGSGILKPKGILSYTSGDAFDAIEQVNSGSIGAATADGLISLQDALLEAFQPGASFLMRRAVWTTIRKLKDSNNNYLAATSGDLTQGDARVLLGKPVKLAADMQAAAADSLSIAYGDFKKGYLIVDRVGIRVLRDPYSTKGQVLFYTTKRVGGGVRNFQAIKLQKFAA